MSSLKERIELLENDLKAVPQRISVYHDRRLPFCATIPRRNGHCGEKSGCWQPGWEAGREVQIIPMSGVALAIDRREARGWRPWSDLNGIAAILPLKTR